MDHFLNTDLAFRYGVPVAVFVAGLIGSPHCALMCGPLALQFGQRSTSNFLYQAGRMISYVLIGTLAGSFGGVALDRIRSPLLSSLALIVLASLMVIMAWREWSHRPLHLTVPKSMEKWMRRLWIGFSNKPIELTAFLSGLLAVLLPCGHLYGFFLGAMATGSAARGATFMFAFWLSTLPALGIGARLVHWKLKRNKISRRWLAATFFMAGLFSLASFAAHLAEPVEQKTQHHCH